MLNFYTKFMKILNAKRKENQKIKIQTNTSQFNLCQSTSAVIIYRHNFPLKNKKAHKICQENKISLSLRLSNS